MHTRYLRILILLFLLPVILKQFSFAQQKDSSSLVFGGYVDAYYAAYSDAAVTDNFQQFPCVSPKSNVIGINIFQLTGQYASDKIRANATFHYGDMPAISWSPSFNQVQEANIGIKLFKKVWLDAGFFKTHIGTEAFLPRDNIVSSLAMVTFYEPLFQSGVKLSYTPNDKLFLCIHVLNGYNIFNENNKKKSVGLTIGYTFNSKLSLAYNAYFGDETPDSIPVSHYRFLNNLILNYQITPKLKVLAGVDFTSQQNSDLTEANKTAFAYGGLLTLKYQIKPKFGIYARGEMFDDKNGFLTGVIFNSKNEFTGLKFMGVTAGLEFKPTENSYIRLEGRDLLTDKNQKIFLTDNKNVNSRLEFMIHAGITFNSNNLIH